MLQSPTVGRIVHFYNESLDTGANNGVGWGPYAATIVQVFDDHQGDGDPYVNLAVTRPFADPAVVFEGSVKRTGARRYEWPPRGAS